MTAAPASWHSFAVVTSSSRVTGRAGTAALSASAPVGATVISVADELLVMTRACLLTGAHVHPVTLVEVAAGEVERLGQVGETGLAGRGPACVHLEHHD